MTVREVAHRLSDARLLLEQLRIAAHSDGADPRSFALLLPKTAELRAWEQDDYASFIAFLKADPPGGLGMSEDQFLVIADLAGVKDLAHELLDQLPIEEGGGYRSVDHSDRDTITVSSISSERGDSETYLRRRLKRDHPQLYQQVVDNKLAASAAAIEAGIRHRTISVRADSAQSAARTLRKHLTPEQCAELARLLTAEVAA